MINKKVTKEFLEDLGKRYSKRLIENKTKWETTMYSYLKEFGYKFKFQIPLVLKIPKGYKLYIVDFILTDNKLIIEVDGLSTHSTKKQVKDDNLRTKRLKKEGFEVIRFWNKQITNLTKEEIKKIIDKKITNKC